MVYRNEWHVDLKAFTGKGFARLVQSRVGSFWVYPNGPGAVGYEVQLLNTISASRYNLKWVKKINAASSEILGIPSGQCHPIESSVGSYHSVSGVYGHSLFL